MKILLIGASGCFGTELTKVCKKDKIKLVSYPSKNLDITNFKDLNSKIEKIKPSIIINSSAIVGINQCETNYNKAFEINTVGALNLAKICKLNNIILVQTSTHAVFDGTKNSSYNENDIPKPNNIYSGSKYLSEVFVKSICKKHYIIRFPTLFGERKNNLLGFVDKVIISLEKNKNLKIANDKIDSPTYAKDAAICLIHILLKKKTYGIYHLANEGKISYFEFVKYIKKFLSSKSKIKPVKDKHFKSEGFKPLKTSLKSLRKTKMRNWKKAINEYLETRRINEKII
jgi:dTDP-4-dehydrorhamnose reductase